jgi:hypothetical protein
MFCKTLAYHVDLLHILLEVHLSVKLLGMECLHVHVSQATAAKHYRRHLLAREDTLRPLPPSPCYSDDVRRRMYMELDYTNDGVVLDLAPDSTTDDEGWVESLAAREP